MTRIGKTRNKQPKRDNFYIIISTLNPNVDLQIIGKAEGPQTAKRGLEWWVVRI